MIYIIRAFSWLRRVIRRKRIPAITKEWNAKIDNYFKNLG